MSMDVQMSSGADSNKNQWENLKNEQNFHPGSIQTERSGMKLSLTPGSLDRPTPLLGQHTAEALTQIIGLSEEEYRSREEDEVLE